MARSEPRGGPQAIVVMGVAGSGKSSLGPELAQRLGWAYEEGDDFHATSNIERMAKGQPLSDADRMPWLAAIRERLDERAAARTSTVVACSALKREYRNVLRQASLEVTFIHLVVPERVLRERLAMRRGHFMTASLLMSQLSTLEPPTDEADSLTIEVTGDINATVDLVIHELAKRAICAAATNP